MPTGIHLALNKPTRFEFGPAYSFNFRSIVTNPEAVAALMRSKDTWLPDLAEARRQMAALQSTERQNQ